MFLLATIVKSRQFYAHGEIAQRVMVGSSVDPMAFCRGMKWEDGRIVSFLFVILRCAEGNR